MPRVAPPIKITESNHNDDRVGHRVLAGHSRDALRFVYGRYRQPATVPGINLYESSNENDKGGDPGDSDESDR